MDEDVIINADRGATLTINSDGSGISAGDVVINGGTINIRAKAFDAIWADSGGISFSNSDVLASGGWTGIRAATNISVNSGRLDARATSANPNRAIVCSSFSVSNQLDVFGSFDVDGPLERYNDSYAFCRVLAWREEVGTVNVDATWEGTPKAATASTINTVVTNTKWYRKNGSSWTELTASDTIKDGSTYRCEVTLEAICGTTFHRNYTVRINGKSAYNKSGNTWYLDKTIPGVFTTQPQGGTVVYNQRHIANWATNFTPVKQELVTYNPTGNVLQVLEISADAVLASCSYLSDGYYYRIRAYYDYSSDAYAESDPFYVTTDPYFTPNYEHGNKEGDIIAGITYVPNGDGTFNANIHVDLSYVDGQMLQHEWYGTGYYWYDHNNKRNDGIGTIDTSKLVFTLNKVGKNLVPGKEWKVKVYLAYDAYCDDEWREVDFPYVTDTVPELKPEDVFTPAFTTQPVGGEVAPGEKLTVSWATNFTPVKTVLMKVIIHPVDGEVVTRENLGTATSAAVGAGYEYCIVRAYYNDSNYVNSNKFYVTEKEAAFVNPFTDVKEGDFYYDPVMWAVENGITTGATATTFNPGGNCLRAHVVTFLHRAAGNPAPSSTKNPFTDVKSSDFFYKPVLWAVEKGITNGTSATTFGSYDNCNRAAVVTFLWRNAGSPEPKSTKNPFVDVKSTDFFYKPVLWAVEQGITNGLDATHFGPATACNRAQVVTFLYRAYN